MRLNNTYGRCLKRALLVTEEKMKKKVGIILLISLLVISSVFASTFTGKARLRLGAWNNATGSSKTWKYGFLDKSEAELKFILQELIGSTTGEGKYFAEVEAVATARVKAGDAYKNFSGEWDAKEVQFKAQFNKANIVFDKDKNFKLGISGTWNQPRYARGWEVSLDHGNLIESDPFFTYATAFESAANHYEYNATASGGWIPGVTLSYDKFAFSFALDGNHYSNPDNDPGLVALFQANNLTVMDGMNVSVAAGYMQSNTMKIRFDELQDTDNNVDTPMELVKTLKDVKSQRHILFGFGLNYASDLVKFDLGVNGNYNVDKNNNPWTYDGYRKSELNEPHGVEASINFAYLGDVKVNFDAWFLDNLGLWSDANVPTLVTMGNQFDLGFVYRTADGEFFIDDTANPFALHKALSMQFGVQPIDALKINVRAQDILNQLIIGADFPISITDAITLTPTFEYTNDTEKKYTKSGWKNSGKANSIIQGALQFNYKHDLFNLFASLRIGTETQATTKSGKGTPIHVRPYLKISSDALVDNLILSLVWEKATFGNQADSPAEKYYSLHTDGTQNFGDIYLEARINF